MERGPSRLRGKLLLLRRFWVGQAGGRDGLEGGRDFLEGREFRNRCGGGRLGGGEGNREWGEGNFLDSFPFPFPGFSCGFGRVGEEVRVVRVGVSFGRGEGVVGEEGEGARGNIYFFYISCSFFYLQFHDFKTYFLFPKQWHFISTTRRK